LNVRNPRSILLFFQASLFRIGLGFYFNDQVRCAFL
jgi:hypothetical protein